MQAHSITVSASAQNLEALTGVRRISQLAMQCPSSNVAEVYFGDRANQPFFIDPAGSTDIMEIKTLADIFVRGTAGDKVYVLTL